MDRIFLGGVVVSLIVGVTWVFVADPAVSAIIAYSAEICFFVIGWRYALKHAPPIDAPARREDAE